VLPCFLPICVLQENSCADEKSTHTVLAWLKYKDSGDAVFTPPIGSGGPSTTSTTTATPLPPPSKTTTTSTTSSSSPTALPTNEVVVAFSDKINTLIYNSLIASVFIGGGLVLEIFTDATINYWAFYGFLTDDQEQVLFNFPLTEVLMPNLPLDIIDNDSGKTALSAGAKVITRFGRRNNKGKLHTPDRLLDTRKGGKRQAAASDDIVVASSNIVIDGGPDINFVPFHLQWLSNLWAKSSGSVTGLCK
jgi:hypothetical protein